MRTVDLGHLGYLPAWEVQRKVAEEVFAGAEDTLLLVEHDPVLTLGASFHAENLLFPKEEYGRRGIEVVETDRGGDVTYHGPGQLVVYPIFNLRRHGQDLHRWMRQLEEALIVAVRSFGVQSIRNAPHTGVWVPSSTEGPPRKLAAIGVKVRKWVSLHGVALNCDNDLTPFSWIVPCGIHGHGVTSLSSETGRRVTVSDAKAPVARAFEAVFSPQAHEPSGRVEPRATAVPQ